MNLFELLKEIKGKWLRNKILKSDINMYRDVYAGSRKSKNSGDTYARDILVFSHVVEKGLSHKSLKPLFGYDRVLKISDSLSNYCKNGGNDSYIIGTAIATLKTYNKVNSELGVPHDKLITIPEVNNCDDSYNIGIKSFNPEKEYNFEEGIFAEFIDKRHSVRLYDCKSSIIKNEDIVNCIKLAQKCPSACNRQAVRVKIIKDHELIEKITDIQGGAKGFGENSDALIFITSEISLYEPAERRMPMFDCGLFTMNLVYALLEKKISTCILNGSFSIEREKKIREIVPIPESEMYAAIIALSKVPSGEIVNVAQSCKRDVNQIIDFIGNN